MAPFEGCENDEGELEDVVHCYGEKGDKSEGDGVRYRIVRTNAIVASH